MSRAAKSAERKCARDEHLDQWAKAHQIKIDRLDEGQKWVVFSALRLLAVIGGISALKRLMGYFLAHCGMGLSGTVIGALIGVSDRSIRQNKQYTADELWQRVSQPTRGHRPRKLEHEHAGILAKYLVEHRRAKVDEILSFLAEKLGITMDRLTLRRYIERYGLGCLRGEVHDDGPLF